MNKIKTKEKARPEKSRLWNYTSVLFADYMERKAADFVLEIYEFQLALFVIGRCRHIGGKALIFKESKRAEGEVAADCNVTVCAAIGTFHNLEERSRKDTAGSFVGGEHCEAAKLIDRRAAVVLVLCIDADVL